MSKDHTERRSYRKSPGRQYGYDYDPLRSRNDGSQNGRGERVNRGDNSLQGGHWPTDGTTPSRAGTMSLQRPDPRKTRQLLRQRIIASKSPQNSEEASEQVEMEATEERRPIERQAEEHHPRQYGSRNINMGRHQGNPYAEPYMPSTRELMPPGEANEGWENLDTEADPDDGYGYEEQPHPRYRYAEDAPSRSLPPNGYARQGVPTHAPVPRRSVRPVAPEPEYEEEYEEYDDDEEEEEERPRRKKKKVSRRGLLLGLGAVAVGGAAGVAAYEYLPKVPQAIGNVGSNIEHQIQDAFNKGLAQGADNARREIITALDNLEGFTLDGAMTAARLTRVAYDVFVSPVIQFGATVAGDVLTGMSRAFKTARNLLIGVGQDNTTLQAIQKVLDSWVGQVSNMPKQLNAITQTDLDGAQAYLRALQRKIEAEKAKLNTTSTTPTPGTPSATPPAQPTTKPSP
jgi:hypothetical protein